MKTIFCKYIKYLTISIVFQFAGEITLFAQSGIFVGSFLCSSRLNSVNAFNTYESNSDYILAAKATEDIINQGFAVQNHTDSVLPDMVDKSVQKSYKSVPAYPYPIEVKQPDGKVLIIRIHGDEHSHFITTEDGYLLVQNKKGYYVYGKEKKSGKVVPTRIVSHNQDKREKKEVRYLKKKSKKSF